MNTIETPRLLLRPLTPEIYQWAFADLDDAALKDYFGCETDAELAEERKKYEQGLSMYRKSLLIFQLLEKSSKKIIGWCGYHTWYLPHNRAELGYMLTDDSRKRQGFMKEALPFVLQYGFEEMKLHRIEAMVGPGNEPSLKLIRSMGFVEEGLLRQHYFTNGKYDDSMVFGLLRSEFNLHVS